MAPTVHIPEAISTLELGFRVTGAKRQAFRTWLGVQALKLGAAIIGCQVEIEFPKERNRPGALLGDPPVAGDINGIDLRVALRLEVLLNGEHQQCVTAYDCEEGWVERHVLGDNGKPQLDPDNPNQVWTEKLRGNVEVRWRQE